MSLSSPHLHSMLRVSIVLVTFNSARWLPRCLESVKAQTLARWELIVVDNASTDTSLAIVRHLMPEARCLRNRANEGFAAANNQGIMTARAAAICLLNADVVLAPHYLERLADDLDAHPAAGGVTGKLLRLEEGGGAARNGPQRFDSTGLFVGPGFFARDRGAGAVDRGQFETPGEVFGVCGAAALLRRTMLDDVASRGEVFDPHYFAFYEDLDLCWRARRRGWSFRYQPKAVAWHARGGSLQARRFFGRPPLFQRIIMCNRYRTVWRNSTPGEVLRHLPALAVAEALLAGYALLRAPHLFRVYGGMLRELPRLARQRRMEHRRRRLAPSDAQLRIAHVVQSRGGGVQKFVLQLCAELDRRRVAVSGICAPSLPGDARQGEESFEAGFERLGVSCTTLPMVRAISPWHDLRALLGLLQWLRREPVDVLHVHSSKAGMVGRLAGLFAGVPVCYSPHAFPFLMAGPGRRLYQMLERVASWSGGVIVVESESERRQAVAARLDRAAELRLIRTAVPVPLRSGSASFIERSSGKGRGELARNLQLDQAAPWITMVGRLVEQKNPAALVHAAPTVLDVSPAAHLLIIGDGPLRAALSALIEQRGLNDRVRLLGYRSDALEIVAASDLFVLPSLWEGLPFVLLEAMARGVPVVVSDCIDEPDLLNDGVEGRVVARGDVQALAQAIVAMLDDPARAGEMAARAVRRVEAYQQLDEMVRQFESLYYELAGLPQPAAGSPQISDADAQRAARLENECGLAGGSAC